jgi:iron complex transport system substrate-binding protein
MARLISLLTLVFLFTGGCSSGDSEPDSADEAKGVFPFTFTDSSGASVTIESPPKRIVSLSAAMTETLYAMGAGPQIVGADRFSNYPATVKPLATLEYSRPAPEPVLALSPDLVLMAQRQSGQVEQFRAVGLKAVQLDEPASLSAVLDRIELVGHITGHSKEAIDLAGGLEKRMAELEARITEHERRTSSAGRGPLVFYEITADGFTAGPDSFLGGLLQTVHARNVAQGATTAFPQLSIEAIIAANPDVILIGNDVPDQTPETVRARPGWQSINAVRNGRIYVVDADVFNRAGPRIGEALETLAKLLYPQLTG